MGTIASVLAGLVLAGATTFGLIASQSSTVNGDTLPPGGTVVTYEQGR